MVTVGVFQIPSPGADGRRLAIYRAAQAAGWLTYEGDCGPADDAAAHRIMITWNPDDIHLDHVDDWVVVVGEPGTSVAYFDETLGSGMSAIPMVAARYAAADALVRGGAPIFSDKGSSIRIPHLGSVSFEDAPPETHADSSVQKAGAEALEIYQTLPLQPGVSASWASGLYREPTQEGFGVQPIDLTGRQRGLVQGPYIVLPAGRWRMGVEFDIVTAADGAHMLFAWGMAGRMVEWSDRVTRSGRYRVTLDAEFPSAGMAELHIALVHPMFHGEFVLSGTRIELLCRP